MVGEVVAQSYVHVALPVHGTANHHCSIQTLVTYNVAIIIVLRAMKIVNFE